MSNVATKETSKYQVVPKTIMVEPFNMTTAEVNIIVQQINIGIIIMMGTILLGIAMFFAFKETRKVLTFVLSTLIFFYSIEIIMLANMVKPSLDAATYNKFRNTAIMFAVFSVVAIISMQFIKKK